MNTYPDFYHGIQNQNNDFFEGWYIKLTACSGICYVFIMGICRGDDPHSFIQFIDGQTNKMTYFRFSSEEFNANDKNLNVKIAENKFSYNRLNVALSNSNVDVVGSIAFNKITRWNDNAMIPGSMGICNHLKFLECYSQVCMLDGILDGVLWVNGQKVDFSSGSVYMEKNWGRSFPKAWFWCQGSDKRSSFTVSFGRVPLLGSCFDGLISAIVVDGKIYQFTTMNLSAIKLSHTPTGCKGLIISPTHILSFKLNIKNTIECPAPQLGAMSSSVKESISSTLKVKLYKKSDNALIYHGNYTNAGAELGGIWEK